MLRPGVDHVVDQRIAQIDGDDGGVGAFVAGGVHGFDQQRDDACGPVDQRVGRLGDQAVVQVGSRGPPGVLPVVEADFVARQVDGIHRRPVQHIVVDGEDLHIGRRHAQALHGVANALRGAAHAQRAERPQLQRPCLAQAAHPAERPAGGGAQQLQRAIAPSAPDLHIAGGSHRVKVHRQIGVPGVALAAQHFIHAQVADGGRDRQQASIGWRRVRTRVDKRPKLVRQRHHGDLCAGHAAHGLDLADHHAQAGCGFEVEHPQRVMHLAASPHTARQRHTRWPCAHQRDRPRRAGEGLHLKDAVLRFAQQAQADELVGRTTGASGGHGIVQPQGDDAAHIGHALHAARVAPLGHVVAQAQHGAAPVGQVFQVLLKRDRLGHVDVLRHAVAGQHGGMRLAGDAQVAQAGGAARHGDAGGQHAQGVPLVALVAVKVAVFDFVGPIVQIVLHAERLGLDVAHVDHAFDRRIVGQPLHAQLAVGHGHAAHACIGDGVQQVAVAHGVLDVRVEREAAGGAPDGEGFDAVQVDAAVGPSQASHEATVFVVKAPRIGEHDGARVAQAIAPVGGGDPCTAIPVRAGLGRQDAVEFVNRAAQLAAGFDVDGQQGLTGEAEGGRLKTAQLNPLDAVLATGAGFVDRDLAQAHVILTQRHACGEGAAQGLGGAVEKPGGSSCRVNINPALFCDGKPQSLYFLIITICNKCINPPVFGVFLFHPLGRSRLHTDPIARPGHGVLNFNVALALHPRAAVGVGGKQICLDVDGDLRGAGAGGAGDPWAGAGWRVQQCTGDAVHVVARHGGAVAVARQAAGGDADVFVIGQRRLADAQGVNPLAVDAQVKDLLQVLILAAEVAVRLRGQVKHRIGLTQHQAHGLPQALAVAATAQAVGGLHAVAGRVHARGFGWRQDAVDDH